MDMENYEAILDRESVDPYDEEVDGIVQEPTQGMEFKSLEEGRAYYDRYAHQIGFSTRKGTHYKSVKNVITSQVFTCSKEGVYKPKRKAHVDDQNAQQVRTPIKQAQSVRTGNEDPAMKEAIKIVFPNTRHRFCEWHIMRKARDHLGVLYNVKEGFEKELKSCINQSLTIEEFETRWASMIINFELENNSHLNLLYKIRERWVPAYFKNTFFGFMSTTQRSESMNALFKDMVDCHMSIYKFVTQYEKILESRHDREDEEIFWSIHSRPSPWSRYPIEKHAIDVYTRNLFKVFQEQLKLTTSFDLDVEEANGLFKVIEVEDLDKPKAVRASYVVTTVAPFTTFCCNCKMFEFSGMLCGHVLKVLIHLKIHQIPSHYILKRWTKEAKDGCIQVALAEDITTEASSLNTVRFNALCRKMLKLASEGSTCADTYSLVIKHMDRALTEVMEMKASIAMSSSTEHGLSENEPTVMKPRSGEMRITQCESMVKDPLPSQYKGRRKVQRFQRPSEAKKSRTCKRCHEKGHNIRTCKAKVDGGPIAVASLEDSEEEELDECDVGI